jgi:site-specific recombinase XerD
MSLFPFSADIAKAKEGGQPTIEPPKAEEFIKYLELKGYSAKTIKSVEKSISAFKTFVESQSQEKDYTKYLKERQNKNHPNKKLELQTINHHLYCLSLYNKYLEGNEKPGLKLNFLLNKLKPKKIETLTIEEVKRLFEATESRPKWAKRDKAVLVCLYHLGLRAGETANLQTEEINWDENWLLIANSKTGHQRQVPMNPTAKAILEDYSKEINPENPYFIQGLKGKLQADSLLQIIKKLVKKAQIQKRVYAHLLRHSIATHLMHNGLDITQVSKFLGHRRLESTERYTHIEF